MATSSLPALSAQQSLRANKVFLTLKFGLDQYKLEYSSANLTRPIVELLYADAERWMSEIHSNLKNGKPIGRYVINLYQISSAEFEMAPIRQSSVLEQNSLVEVVLVPVGANENRHWLRECQLNRPTFCSKCTHLIGGVYKQGFRCRKCRKTYHKKCAPFFEDDCPIEADNQPNGKSSSKTPTLTFINPFANTTSGQPSTISQSPEQDKKLPDGIRRPTSNINENSIIDKGVFPACFLGAITYHRYLFRLTTNKLSISTNVSEQNFAQMELSTSANNDYIIALADIEDLLLTHHAADHDDVFEIHLRVGPVISVGKRTDAQSLQMDTAQFYSSLREQRETLANATPSNRSPVPDPDDSMKKLPRLRDVKSNFRLGEKELHEQYAFTGEKIGQGSFGRVVGAYKKSTKAPRAVKIIEKRSCSEQDMQLINKEIDHLFRFNHINILRLEAYYERMEAVYLVTERMERDMCEYIITSPNRYLDEPTCKILIYQVIVALRYLHDNGCGHLDVKCENILISMLKPVPTSNSSGRPPSGIDSARDYPLVKLADFGYTRQIGEHSFRKTCVGTKVYNAPEVNDSRVGYNRLADMWSAGVVMYAALSGDLPFGEKSCSSVEQIASEKEVIFSNERWAHITDTAIDLLENHLMVIKVESRANTSGALFHDWFSDFQLFRHLREIERRTKRLMKESQQEITPSERWLTAQRADPVWLEYQANCH